MRNLVVMVTRAAGGIGYHIAKRYAEKRCKVIARVEIGIE